MIDDAVGASRSRSRVASALRGLLLVVSLGLLAAGIFFALNPGARTELVAWIRFDIGAPESTQPLLALPTDDPPQLRLAAAGDVGTGGDAERETAAAMAALEPEMEYQALLLLGDNVYPNGDPDRVDTTVFDPFADVLDNDTQLLAVLGNHDVRDNNGDAQAAALGMPMRWYATEFDDALVVALDSNQPDNPEQQRWLNDTLADSTAQSKIAIMHHPPYSGGYHGSDTSVRAAFSPAFERHGVQLVLTGHDHDYQRSRSINGVSYVVSGAAAKRRRTGKADFTEVAWSTHHFIDLAIWDDRILVRAVDRDGRQIDEVTIDTTRPAG